MKTTSVVRGLIGAAFCLLLGCGGKIDKTKLENAIDSGTKAQGVSFKTIECPTGQPAKKGADFDCIAKTAEGDVVTVHITQKDNSGDVDWKLTGTILDTAKLGDSIESKIGSGADVMCPASTIVLTKGRIIRCKVAMKGQIRSVEITAIDDAGEVKWKII